MSLDNESRMRSRSLRELIAFSRDGEWGKGEPFQNALPMRVIRGTDFESVGSGDLGTAPVRYISEKSAVRKSLQSGDILIETAGGSKTRPTGRTMCVQRRLIEESDLPLTCASFARFIRIDEELAEPGFVFWYLQNLYKQGEMAQHQVQHTGVARFQFTRFAESTIIRIPDRASQRWIASTLGTFDDKIELNLKMNRTLEEIAQTLFRAWFVDFEGETDLVESELGPIPRGWEVVPLADEFELTMGQSPPGSTYNETGEGLPFYQGATDFGFRFPALRVFCIEPKRVAEPGDTLVSVRAPVGRVNRAAARCCIGRGVAALRHQSGAESYTYFVAKHLEERFERFNAEGTVFGSISKKDFLRIPVLKPPSDLLQRFSEVIEPVDKRVEIASHQSRTLADLRDTLLPKLISGEIRVPEVEEAVEEAV